MEALNDYGIIGLLIASILNLVQLERVRREVKHMIRREIKTHEYYCKNFWGIKPKETL